jgi:hypothetical protein
MTFESQGAETHKKNEEVQHAHRTAHAPSPDSRTGAGDDTALRIPGTRMSVGADSVLGLIPGVGDFAAAAVSLIIVNEARRLGVPNDKLVKMLVNVGFDTVAGSMPVLGDVFDVYFKSNRRNFQLVLDHFGLDRADLDR